MLKQLSKMLCTVLLVALVLTGCKPTTDNGGGIGDKSSTISDITDAVTSAETIKGGYVETEITPSGLKKAYGIQFQKGSDGTLLLCIKDEATLTPRAFLRKGDEWIEQDNKHVLDFLSSQNISGSKFHYESTFNAFYDFYGNWWVGIINTDSNYSVYKIDKDGNVLEIVTPYLKAKNEKHESTHLANIGTNDSGKACISMLDKNLAVCWDIVDIATGKVLNEMQNMVAEDPWPNLKGDTLYGYNMREKKLHTYDIVSGDLMDTVSVSIKKNMYVSLDEMSQLVYADTEGIHRVVLDGSVIQTVVDNAEFACSSAMSVKHVLAGPDNSFWLLTINQGNFNIYQYTIDKDLTTTPKKKLTAWAMNENPVLNEAAGAFARQNPDYEVVMEFGRANGVEGVLDEDIIKSLNTRLLAGKTPDVLILDGLPIASLIDQGLLSPLENIVDEKDYYSNILNCYQKDGKSYAYPTNFEIPVIIGAGNEYDVTKIDTLEKLANLYKDKKAISNDSYSDVFNTAYGAYSSQIFKDGKTLDENALTEFLTQTKAMVDGQGIKDENDSIITTPENVQYNLVPSILSFRQNKTQYATGIIESPGTGMVALQNHKDIKIEPHPGKGFLTYNISSIPADAVNKEQAANFIEILLTEENIQVMSNASAFPVRKEYTRSAIETMLVAYKERGEEFMTDPLKFDWDGLISKLETPSNPEAFLRETVYEQATLLYTDSIDVNTAKKKILSKTRLYFAEKQ